MKEPFVPEPPPERNAHWDPAPALCSTCGVILQNLKPLKGWGWQGWCPKHGCVPAEYR